MSWGWWGCPVRFLSGDVRLLCSSSFPPCFLTSYSSAPSNLLYPPSGPFRSAGPPDVLVLFGLWLRDEIRYLETQLNLPRFRVTEVVTLCNTDLLIEDSTGLVNSPIYLYTLSEWLKTQLHFYFELLQSLSLPMQASCFRVAKISFYIVTSLFTYWHFKISFPTVWQFRVRQSHRWLKMQEKKTSLLINWGLVI